MFTIHIFNYELEEFQDINFNENDIVRFGIINKKRYNKNGTFKKFEKRAFVETKDHKYESYQIDLIKELKTALKGKYTISKYEDFEYKNYNERKAIDWTYTIKDKVTITE